MITRLTRITCDYCNIANEYPTLLHARKDGWAIHQTTGFFTDDFCARHKHPRFEHQSNGEIWEYR